MLIQSPRLLLQFPISYTLEDAVEYVRKWEPDSMKWGIVNRYPVVYAEKLSRFRFRDGKIIAQGITIEKGDFKTPILNNPILQDGAISQGGGSQERDCEPERRQIRDCNEKLALENDMERTLRSTIDDRDKQIENMREEIENLRKELKHANERPRNIPVPPYFIPVQEEISETKKYPNFFSRTSHDATKTSILL